MAGWLAGKFCLDGKQKSFKMSNGWEKFCPDGKQKSFMEKLDIDLGLAQHADLGPVVQGNFVTSILLRQLDITYLTERFNAKIN
jgi:hypothetical protein